MTYFEGRWNLTRRFGLLTKRVDNIERKLNMAQSDIDALTAELQTVATDTAQVAADLDGAQRSLQAEIDQLASQNPDLNWTALKAAADALDPVVQSIDAKAKAIAGLVPTPPAPPVV